MSWWTETVLPHCVDRALRAPAFARERARLLEGVRGRVLEIGFGSGLNLPHYGPWVTDVLAVEPSQVARDLARGALAHAASPVRFVGLDAGRLELPDASVDAAVSTWTLCTVPDPSAALRELARVLRPGGRFVFLEHGLSCDPRVARWQRRLDPLQRRLAGGCRLTRRFDELVRSSPLELVEHETLELDLPRVAAFHYRGSARRVP